MKYIFIILMMAMSNFVVLAIAEENHSEYKSYVDDIHGFYKVYDSKTNNIDQFYQNKLLNINKGDTVVWINEQDDNERLTIISEQQLWNNNTGTLAMNYKEFKYTFNETGIYNIYLQEKPKKTQKIIVGPMNYSNINKDNIDFTFKFQSPDIGEHQGISTDGKNYYVFGTSSIKKYDQNWNLIAKNDNINNESGYPHSVDGQYYNGKLYVPAGGYNYSFKDWAITVWDASDLSFVLKHSISAQKIDPMGLSIDGDNIYTIADGYNIEKYDLNFNYLGRLSIKPHLPDYPQGITKKGDYFYVTDSGNGAIYRIYKDGKNLGIIWNTMGYIEGIDYSTDTLLYLTDFDTDSEMNKYIVGLTENISNSEITIAERMAINHTNATGSKIVDINSMNGPGISKPIKNSTNASGINNYKTDINSSSILVLIAATSIPIYILSRKKEIKK